MNITTIRPKNVAPSIRAAEIIIAVWIFPATSGWRAMLSTAQEPILLMPYPAPMMISPAPKAPPRKMEKPSRPKIP